MRRASNLKVWTSLLVAAVCAAMMVVALGARSAEAAFPGSNGSLAYDLSSDTQSAQVYRMSTDGFGKTKLSDTVGANSQPDWSSNGTKVAFTNSNPNIDADAGEIYWMGSWGSAEVNLTKNPADDREPSFFPDFHKIAFSSNRGGNWDIWVMTVDNRGVPVDGNQPIRMTNHTANDSQPAVSPDGTQIAFVRETSGNKDIYVMEANTPEHVFKPTLLQGGSQSDEEFPEWAPGGSRIFFASNKDGNYNIWMNHPNPDSIPARLTQSPVDDIMPAASPDGTKIAFASQRGGGEGIYNIFKMRDAHPCGATVCAQTAITTSKTSDFLNPSWQPDP